MSSHSIRRRGVGCGKRTGKAPTKGGVNSIRSWIYCCERCPGPARLADLAHRDALGQGAPYVTSLVRAGLVEQDPGTVSTTSDRWRSDAGVVISRSDALKRAERVLSAIVERTVKLRQLRCGAWPTLVRLVEARHELASSVPLGHVCALTFSAAGLVYCAYGNPDRLAPLVTRELGQSRTVGRQGVPTTKADVERLVTTVRAQGFATVAEGDGGLSAVSAPVFDAGQRLQLALSVFGRAGQRHLASGSRWWR